MSINTFLLLDLVAVEKLLAWMYQNRKKFFSRYITHFVYDGYRHRHSDDNLYTLDKMSAFVAEHLDKFMRTMSTASRNLWMWKNQFTLVIATRWPANKTLPNFENMVIFNNCAVSRPILSDRSDSRKHHLLENFRSSECLGWRFNRPSIQLLLFWRNDNDSSDNSNLIA